MSRTGEYREKAVACERQAAEAKDEALKKHYLTLAEAWRGLAEQGEPARRGLPTHQKA